jgi:aryl-alcohol dehydrogenase-like predicted oxidoreductase
MEERMTDSNNPSNINRRQALLTASSIIPASLLANNATAQTENDDLLPKRTLGRTKEEISVLTLGTGHFRSSYMDMKRVGDIVDRAQELGVTSIDTAPNYDEAEDYLGEVLKGRRDQFFLSTKCEEPTYKGAWDLLKKSLKRLKTDRIDVVYMHNFGYLPRFKNIKETLSKVGVLGALIEAKEQGVIRYIGASGHLYPSRFYHLFERDEVDIYLCAVNHVARHQYNFEQKVFANIRHLNAGLIAMKVLGGAVDYSIGTPRLNDQKEKCIRYAMGLPGIASLNVGFRKVSELEEIATYIKNYKPFNRTEQKIFLEEGKKNRGCLRPALR